jgi:hypothetical protein
MITVGEVVSGVSLNKLDVIPRIVVLQPARASAKNEYDNNLDQPAILNKITPYQSLSIKEMSL